MEIPENKLIRKIRQFERRSDEILRGIGDDGAVVAMSEGAYVLVQDAMVEHVHFEFDFVDPYDLGKKALYSNISDVLAMGAQPLYYMVTIAVPDKVTSKEIGRLYRGMNRAAKEFDVIMIGGDTTGSMRDSFYWAMALSIDPPLWSSPPADAPILPQVPREMAIDSPAPSATG